ncbi:MAG: hypothetical protein MUE85_16310 [Microscillaceae bacterium]|jgi:hypothetical protein|nr:hypothetical protein [Microscillaceae bacterium]
MRKRIMFFVFILFGSLALKAQSDRLLSGQEFKFDVDEQAQLISKNGQYLLFATVNGQLSVARKYGGKWVNIWNVRGTGEGPVKGIFMQKDGNFVIYDYNGPIWSSGTHGNPGAWCVIQDDGNFVIYNANRKAIWATGTNK